MYNYFSVESILLFLITGLIFGFAFIVIQLLKNVINFKKIYLYLLDFTFITMSGVVIFIVALATSSARLRLMQILCQMLGLICVFYVFNCKKKCKK